MINRKPRIGFAPITLSLFWSLYPELKERTGEALKIVEDKLKQYVEVYSTGLIGDRTEADKAGKLLSREDIDLLVIWESGYVTSDVPIQIINHVDGIPVVLLITQRDSHVPGGMDYVRYMENTALTSMVELGGALFKNQAGFNTIVGRNDEEEAYTRLASYAKVSMIKSELKKLNIGVCGHVFPGMLDITVDERFANSIGPQITHITLPEIERRVKAMKHERVERFIEETGGIYDATCVKKEDLFRAARFYCVLEDLKDELGVNAFSLLCQDFIDVAADTPPCFALSMAQNRLGIVSGCEGDIGNTIGAFIIKSLTGKSPMFVDWTMYDEKENAVFFQHCGIADPDITCSPVLKPHSEKFGFSGDGVAFEVSGKPGAVTMVSMIYGKNGWKIFASEGEAMQVEAQPCRLNQITVKVKAPVKEFLEKACNIGLTHHLNVGYGHLAAEIKYLAGILSIEYVSL